MSRWENDEIIAEFDGFSDDFADNSLRAYNIRNGWLVFYVEYTKGSEGYVEIQLYFDNSNRAQLLEANPAYENWFAYGSDGIYPAEGNQAAAVTDHIPSRAIPWRFTGSGKHRIMVMSLPREDAIKVAVRGDNVGDGNVKVRFCSDEIAWGHVGQGGE